MNGKKISGGLLLILAREPDACVQAGHDVIYAGNSRDAAYTAADFAALKALGWEPDATIAEAVGDEDEVPWSVMV